MKSLLLGLTLLSINAHAFPEDLIPQRIGTISYKSSDHCPFNFCRNDDEGFGMRKWCELHNGRFGDNPILVGWTKVSGYACFCGCNNIW
ncbi:MAG: hypothetical protein H7336_15350 [Bacteriovorax sp.]|nr:hypothetical protein [Bacteriovorax sp.]